MPSPFNASSRASSAGVLQRQWVDAGNGMLRWNRPMQGRHWFYNSADQRMAFRVEPGGEEPPSDLAGRWQSHGEWLRSGWGLFPSQRGEEEKKKAEEDVLEKFARDGRRRFARLRAPAGSLSARTQHSRDWFFQNYYSQDPRHSADPMNIKTNYRYLPPGAAPSTSGQYVNQFDILAGRIVADQNYSLEGGEMYYDLETEQIASMSNSEILYQQWKIAKSRAEAQNGGHPIDARVRVLRRAHVAGPEGRTVTQAIRRHVGHTDDITFTSENPLFYTLLGTPNCVSAIWLICDHGGEMGIRGIESITLKRGNSIEVNFLPA